MGVRPCFPKLLRVVSEATRAWGAMSSRSRDGAAPGVPGATTQRTWPLRPGSGRQARESPVRWSGRGHRGGSAQCDGRWRVAVMRMSPSVPLQRALYDLCPNGIFNRSSRLESVEWQREAANKRPGPVGLERALRVARGAQPPPGLTVVLQNRRTKRRAAFTSAFPPARLSLAL